MRNLLSASNDKINILNLNFSEAFNATIEVNQFENIIIYIILI